MFNLISSSGLVLAGERVRFIDQDYGGRSSEEKGDIYRG